jgi:hypothetical protein
MIGSASSKTATEATSAQTLSIRIYNDAQVRSGVLHSASDRLPGYSGRLEFESTGIRSRWSSDTFRLASEGLLVFRREEVARMRVGAKRFQANPGALIASKGRTLSLESRGGLPASF